MPEDHFGERVAERYDEWDAASFEPPVVDPVVDFLVAIAGEGAALELGIGTGRIALPLARRGVRVHGIDLSAAMVARLRAKPGSEQIEVTVGDFANTRVAAHLEPSGCFVIEVGVPQLQRLPPGETVRAFDISSAPLGFDEYDVASQGLVSHHYRTVDDKLEVQSVPFRYVWPSELDLMARLAGLTLRERWGGWKREPFTGDSEMHVSVWEKPAAALG